MSGLYLTQSLQFVQSGQDAAQQKSRRKKRKKKGKSQGAAARGDQNTEGHTTPAKTRGRDEIDTAVEEVNKLLGGTLPSSSGSSEQPTRHTARPILAVDKR